MFVRKGEAGLKGKVEKPYSLATLIMLHSFIVDVHYQT